LAQRQYIDPQFDLFVPYVSDLPLRDQRETMERPFFSLSKKKRLKPIEYTSPDGKLFVNVFPNQQFGMATIWDADVLIWAASRLYEEKRKGKNDISRTIHFQPFDLLKTINRDTGGREYRLLRDSLARLQSTTIRTNIRAEKTKRKERQFGWIESWVDLVDEQTETSRGMSITLSDWFYEGVLMEGGVLAIDPAYFTITGGRERWLYRVARKHAGGAGPDGFAIPLPTLFEKSGAEGTYRRFKFEIQAMVKRNDLPEVALAIEDNDRGEPALRMTRREAIGASQGQERAGGAPPPRQKPQKAPRAAKKPAEALPLFGASTPNLDDDTISRVRRDFPGWDIYALKGEFDDWIAGKSERRPENYQAAFYGFAKQWHAKNKHQLRSS